MVNADLVVWLVPMLLISLGFSVSFSILTPNFNQRSEFQLAPSAGPLRPWSYGAITLDLSAGGPFFLPFWALYGFFEPGEVAAAPGSSSISPFVLWVYLMVALVLFINLLISMFNQTYGEVFKEAREEWKMQVRERGFCDYLLPLLMPTILSSSSPLLLSSCSPSRLSPSRLPRSQRVLKIKIFLKQYPAPPPLNVPCLLLDLLIRLMRRLASAWDKRRKDDSEHRASELTALQAETAENRAMNAFLRRNERVEMGAGGRLMFTQRMKALSNPNGDKNTAFSLNEVLTKLERFEEKLSAQRDGHGRDSRSLSDSRMGTPEHGHRSRSHSVHSSVSRSTSWEYSRSVQNARHSRHHVLSSAGSSDSLSGGGDRRGYPHRALRHSQESANSVISSAASSPRPPSETGNGSPPPPPSRQVSGYSDDGSDSLNDSFSRSDHALRNEVVSLRGQVDYLGAILRELAVKQGVTLPPTPPAATSPQERLIDAPFQPTRNLNPEMHQVLQRAASHGGGGGDSPAMARFRQGGILNKKEEKDPKVRWKKACRFALSTEAAASSSPQAPLPPPTPGLRASPLEDQPTDAASRALGAASAGPEWEPPSRGQAGRSTRLPPAAKLPPPPPAAVSVEEQSQIESYQPPVPHRPPPVQPPATPTVIVVGEPPLTVEKYVGSEGMVLFKM